MDTTAPIVNAVPIENAIAGAIHGPYEDLFLEGLKILAIVIQDAPPAVKLELWNQFLAFQTGLHSLASKIDVFHLFTAKN
jgi:hypothetical protein